jgi:hypothetical protein
VAYLEGWYVDRDVRRHGIGAALVHAAEAWARERGYRELASDAPTFWTKRVSAVTPWTFVGIPRSFDIHPRWSCRWRVRGRLRATLSSLLAVALLWPLAGGTGSVQGRMAQSSSAIIEAHEMSSRLSAARFENPGHDRLYPVVR